MTSSDIGNIHIASRKSAPLLEAMARAGVHKMLGHLRRGRLLIEENGLTYSFGEHGAAIDPVAHVSVHRPGAYRQVLFGGSVGAGESFMLGDWTSPDLVKVIRLFVLNMEVVAQMDSNLSPLGKLSSRMLNWLNSNSRSGSRRNIAAHYDLSNDFFRLILDKQMMYSAAIFPSATAGLERASVHKLAVVCEKLQLQPQDHLLEIGTGWGGLAVYAAKNYGCRVTTTTLSRQQFNYARQWVEREGLQGLVEVLLRDYRDLNGQFDKLVSIEMIEAVGHRYHGQYFRQCSRLLKPNGLMLVQAITIADQRYRAYRNAVDFIQKYIFPGGCLPCNQVIAHHVASNTDMQIIDLQDITAHYARTLHSWRERFNRRRDSIRALGFDTAFMRMWEFYLCYCEGGFDERAIGTAQFVLAKPEYRFA